MKKTICLALMMVLLLMVGSVSGQSNGTYSERDMKIRMAGGPGGPGGPASGPRGGPGPGWGPRGGPGPGPGPGWGPRGGPGPGPAWGPGPGWAPGWGLGWAWGPPLYWGAPYPNYVMPPVVIEQSPPIYVEPDLEAEQVYYWYHCENPQGYYPYVKQCPGGWTKVSPSPASPGQ
jgi:hypothetical protein